jgi:hypothetical protein
VVNPKSEMNPRVLFYGKDEPLPERVPLRAGPLTMVYENGDLRYVRYGEREVVRRIYAAARDRKWGTAPNTLSDVHMDVREDSFNISYTCENKLNDVHFVWQGRITGNSDGTIEFSFDGTAQSTFLRNRLGLCLLHPIGVAGLPAHIEKVDGSIVEATFPKRIAPQMIVNGQIKPVAPFDEMRAVSHEVAPGVTLRLAFEGDIFEMEDQRNWTDGSYKTYCTPLRLPFPAEVTEGERVTQQIALTLEVKSQKLEVKSEKSEQSVVNFSLLTSHFPLPKLGVSVAGNGKAISKKEAERLKVLKLSHLRVDLALWQSDWKAKLKKAAKDAALLGSKLEIGLFVTDAAGDELKQFVEAMRGMKLPVARYLIHHCKEQATGQKWIELARHHLGPKAVVYSGTNLFFTELNRNRPDAKKLALLDGLCYSFNPQVHAFDNTSLTEAPEAQAETVRTYKTFSTGKPLAITTITLKPRHSLGDPGPETSNTRGEFDPRQMSLFGAGWTVVSLKYVSQADGATSATYYETTGKRGLMDGAQVFPMYHVFADVAEFGGKLIATKTSDPLKVDGLALRKGKRTRVLLANLTDQPQTTSLKGLGNKATVKIMDVSNAESAMRKPEAFRAQQGVQLDSSTITLPPYAIARIDSTHE